MSRLHRVRSFLRFPVREQWLMVQTFVLLGLARAAILRVGFGRLERLMGDRQTESPRQLSEDQLLAAAQVARSLRVVSPRTPWTSNCFPQALVGAFLLRRRGIEPTIYLGARIDRSVDAGMAAHAWLRAGERYVAGGDGSKAYGTLIAYSRSGERVATNEQPAPADEPV